MLVYDSYQDIVLFHTHELPFERVSIQGIDFRIVGTTQYIQVLFLLTTYTH